MNEKKTKVYIYIYIYIYIYFDECDHRPIDFSSLTG
jgi:hypothetical protein